MAGNGSGVEDGVLAGETAIVTGSGRNIGRAIAKRFAEEGATVVVADVDPAAAEATVNAIRDAGGHATAAEVDVTDRTEVSEMVADAESSHGSIDVLVNNVATTDDTPFLELSTETFRDVLEVNLTGTFICTQEVARSMKETGGGRILNVGSTSAHQSRPTAVAYSTSKNGLLRFTKSTAKALAAHDIRVNALSPTRSGSPVDHERQRTGEPDEDILVGRWGTPDDQAEAALFLVAPRSDFITGVELPVDGGALASR